MERSEPRGLTNTQAWDYALGMIKVDGLTPSAQFMALVEREKRGEMTTEEMRHIILGKYISEDALG